MSNKKFSNPNSIHVLVVDDMSLGRLSAKSLLQQCGFSDITLANSGLEAWKLMSEADEKGNPFQLVLSDWVMPDMSGIELVQKMKTRQWKVRPWIILVTAETDMGLIKQVLKEGASGYIRKPLTLASLQEALEQLQ